MFKNLTWLYPSFTICYLKYLELCFMIQEAMRTNYFYLLQCGIITILIQPQRFFTLNSLC